MKEVWEIHEPTVTYQTMCINIFVQKELQAFSNGDPKTKENYERIKIWLEKYIYFMSVLKEVFVGQPHFD